MFGYQAAHVVAPDHSCLPFRRFRGRDRACSVLDPAPSYRRSSGSLKRSARRSIAATAHAPFHPAGPVPIQMNAW